MFCAQKMISYQTNCSLSFSTFFLAFFSQQSPQTEFQSSRVASSKLVTWQKHKTLNQTIFKNKVQDNFRITQKALETFQKGCLMIWERLLLSFQLCFSISSFHSMNLLLRTWELLAKRMTAVVIQDSPSEVAYKMRKEMKKVLKFKVL